MTTVITVHGTFAHVASDSVAPLEGPAAVAASSAPSPWWQRESAFAKLVAELSSTTGDAVKVESFEWSGLNSETSRREAGLELFEKLRALEARGEKYSIVAHSHGGSVVSWALLYAVRKKVALDGLHKWITVGTPFVELRRERYLFMRLPILLKAVFVASLMLLFMFLFYGVSDYLSRGWMFQNRYFGVWRFVISAALASLPFVLFYIVARYWDGRQLFFYRRGIVRRARERYGSKWVGLCHEDDEAVQGLSSLRDMNVPIFERRFAVPVLSIMSVFILPMAYLYVVTSPPTMVAIAEFLSARVYEVKALEQVEPAFSAEQREIRSVRREIRRTRAMIDRAESQSDVTKRLDAESQLKSLVEQRRALRQKFEDAFPNAVQLQRTDRFARRFLQRDGKPCEDARLCDGGRNLALNSRLLFHLVTDEASSWLVDEDLRWSTYGRLVRYTVPVILVPIVFGLVAMAMVLIVQWLAVRISAVSSRMLDRMTWKQVRRAALGNDTESEVALAAMPCPPWLDVHPRYLPPDLGRIITEHSNKAMIESLGKIRNAISDLAFADGTRQSDVAAAVLGYLNWKELIHTTYFEVPEFRAFIAHVLADGEAGSRPDTLAQTLDEATARTWLLALNGPPMDATPVEERKSA